MRKSITFTTRSPLGHWISLLLVTAGLLLFGMYLATDGSFFAKTLPSAIDSSPMFGGAIQRGGQNIAKVSLASIADHLKKYERQELLFAFGGAIFAGFLVAGLLGRWFRSYRFRFIARTGPGKGGLVERREMWLFLPAWLLGWLVMGVLFWAVLSGRPWAVLPSWLILAVAGPPVIVWILWALFPDLLEKDLFILRWRRIPLWALAWPVLAVLVPLGAGMARLSFSASIPAWVLPAVIIPPAPLILLWAFLPELAKFRLYIPGIRWRAASSSVKRLEIQSSGEGATVLVLTLRDERAWTVSSGTPKRLQRLGGTLARMLGLERRDLMTWS